MFDDPNAVQLEETVSVVVFYGPGRCMGAPVDLQNAPLAPMADEEVRLPILTASPLPESGTTIRKKQYSCRIQCLRNTNFAGGAKPQVVPFERALVRKQVVVGIDSARGL